jgi:uncharacterized membrane protein
MDPGYLLEVLGLLGRWVHVIVAIAWIGSSFYFVWLDDSLEPVTDPEAKARGVYGSLWSVHGGGFYHAQKYPLGPTRLPDTLHWFYWESYSTFLSGFFLLSVLYYAQATALLVDPAKWAVGPAASIAVSLAVLAGGWVFYDLLCRVLIERSQLLLAAIYYLFVMAVAAALLAVFPGRAAYLHVGAMIATTMSANVFFWIIPGQRKVTAALRAGDAPDPVHGKRGKQRSVHNNYLTLPVLFCMISNHYAFTYGSRWAWAILALSLLAAALIRHFFNLRHKGVVAWHFPFVGVGLLLIAFWLASPARATLSGSAPALVEVQGIIDARCVPCHAVHPRLIPAPPLGVVLEGEANIRANARRIVEQAAHTRAMPMGNVTQITDAERQRLLEWEAGGYR